MKTLYWNRRPGQFVNKNTGERIELTLRGRPGPAFTGSVREWYETLVETLIDLSNQLGRGRIKGEYTVHVSPDVLCILESTVLYKPDSRKGGTLCGMQIQESRNVKRFEVEMQHGSERGKIIITED